MTPGEAELAQRELGAAEEALREFAVLADAGSTRGAASRLYYAVFHAARAALAVRGLHAKTHSGQIGLFRTTFGPDRILDPLLELRARADYGREDFTTSVGELRNRAAEAEVFIDRCRKIVDEALELGPDEPDPPPDY